MIIEKRVKVGTGIFRVDRVRGGKVQRKKLTSSRKGYKIVGKKSVRMNPAEKRKRAISGKRGARKRAAKLTSILRKRKVSITKGKRQRIY